VRVVSEDADPGPHPQDKDPGPRPPLIHADVTHDDAGPSTTPGPEEVLLRQLLSDEFACFYLRLDHMRKQHPQDHAELLRRQDEWDR